MFYIIQGMETKSTKQIAEELDRNYKAVLNFVHEVQDLASQHMEEIPLEGVCEADEVYVTAGEKGKKQKKPRERGLQQRGRGTFAGDQPPALTLAKRNGGHESEVRFLVLRNLQHVQAAIEACAVGEVLLNTDGYTIYNGITAVDGVSEHRVVDRSTTYAKGDVHVNTCENRHSFVRGWLRKFRGVSKWYLQGYLDFLALTLNTDGWFKKIISTNSHG